MPDRYIVIRKSQRTLELYEGNRAVGHYPIAIGKTATPTPEGTFTIAVKRFQPGGMYGSRWLGLSIPGYGIHGTNNPSSIGQAVSKGCIRMHNHNVESVFGRVQVGTKVLIYP